MKQPFLWGALLYPAVELVWRRRTHPAMALAGGMAMKALDEISRTQKHRPLWQQALLGGAVITGMEYAVGRVLNRRYQIWDYRQMPMQLHGQICLPFSLAWCAFSALGLGLIRMTERQPSKSSMRRMR